MRVKLRMKAFLMSSALCLAGLPAAGQQQSSSQQGTGDAVADAARKAREAKKDAPKAKRVITDDDLKKSAPDSTPTPSAADANSTAGAATTVQVAGNPAKGEDPNGEAAWRRRFKEAHDQLAKAEKELDVLSRELEKAQTEYYPDPQKAMKEQNSRAEINDKTARIDAKKKEIAQLKQGLDDLEDQLRKSGGDPGWAR